MCKYLKDKFHFSEVHANMNATGHVQSKWHPKCVTLTLHRTRCVHTSMHLRKMKIISYIYTLIYIVFVHYLWNFYLHLANTWRRKIIIRSVWLLRSTAVTMTWRQSKVTLANQLLHLSMTSLTRKVAWTSVVHGRTNLVGPKEVHVRKLLASVNIKRWNSYLWHSSKHERNGSSAKYM